MEIFLRGQDSDFVNSHVSESSPGNPSHPDPVIPQSENNGTFGATLWTSKEVAKHLHVSLKTLFNLRKRGFPYIQLGGSIRYVPQKVEDYLLSNSGLDSHRRRQIVRKGMKS
jgi:hypothetical protein